MRVPPAAPPGFIACAWRRKFSASCITMVRSDGPVPGRALVSATMQSTPAPGGRLAPRKAWAIQPSLSVWLAADAVSQISIERKCERLGDG